MRRKALCNTKLVVKVESNKATKQIKTISVYDNRTQSYWNDDQIQERGVEWFLNLRNLKESLNWNLNGDESRYKFKWGQSSKTHSEGFAYVF